MRTIVEERHRDSVRRAVRGAVQRGELSRPLRCENCKKIADRLEAHHVDYDKPLEVQWLCRRCHAGEHRESYGHRRIRRSLDGELTHAESAVYLGYTPRYLYKISKKIPHRKESGTLYYKRADLDTFRDGRSTQHIPEGVS